MIPIGTEVQVYFNIRRKVFSIRAMNENGDWRVADHTTSILLDNALCVVNEAGRQRVLRTKEKNVHAWIQGTLMLYQNVDGRGMKPLALWKWKELCLRELTYNPYKHIGFVRRDQQANTVSHVDRMLLEVTDDRKPKLWAWLNNMWGEFSKPTKNCYEIMAETDHHWIPAHSAYRSYFEEMDRSGIIWCQCEDRGAVPGRVYFWRDYIVSPLSEHVCRYGMNTWGFWDESESHFRYGFATDSEAYAALQKYASTL
jgi:hypothetical protein